MEIVQIPVLEDNYVYLAHHAGLTAVVDPAVEEPVVAELARRGWKLDFIWNTHHHGDHVGANLALKARFGCEVYGSAKDARRIPGLSRGLYDGDRFTFAGEEVRVIGVDGHTVGHIAYHLPGAKVLFCGDTIFSLGCGKLFEGSAEQMWAALEKLRALPAETMVCTAHEYTLENALFAVKVEPGNADLRARIEEAKAQRAAGKPTVPVAIGRENATNPFLRPESAEIQRHVGMEGADQPLAKIFGATRAAKDRFDSGN